MRKLLIILLVLITIFFLFGCSKKPEEVCYKISDDNERDSCYLDITKNLNVSELSICEKINENNRELCYINLFNNSKTTVDCNDIGTMEIKDTCNMVVGMELSKPFICDVIYDLTKRDNCYFQIINNFNYPLEVSKQICGNIINDYKKNKCFGLI
ncbi:MAG: hypothetical protein AABW92_01435 [Nanoarchaeota archaeon]